MTKPAKAAAPQDKQAALKRFAQAEQVCLQLQTLFAALADDERWQAHDMAPKYAQMAGVYQRKIRNNKVLSAADFNAAVEVCTAARRGLKAFDASLVFDGHPQQTALQTAAQGTYQVLAAHQQLLNSGKR